MISQERVFIHEWKYLSVEECSYSCVSKMNVGKGGIQFECKRREKKCLFIENEKLCLVCHFENDFKSLKGFPHAIMFERFKSSHVYFL